MAALVPATSCSDAQLAQGAALVYASLPAFYDLFGSAGVNVGAVIARSFHVPGTSVEHAMFALQDGAVVGVVAAHDVAQLRRTGYVDLQQLLREIPAPAVASVKEAVRAHAQKVAPLVDEGRYLARIAVAPSSRGSGLAAALLDHFEQQSARFYLHVHRENARAIAFYHRRGYAFAGVDFEFRVMAK